MRKFKLLIIAGGLAFMIATTATVHAKATSITTTVAQTEIKKVVEHKKVQTEPKEDKGFVPYEIPEEYARSGGEFPAELQEFAAGLCEEYEIPYALVVAMVEVESAYKADAVSSCGALGYMQIVRKWHQGRAEDLGYTDLRDPKANLHTGIDYLATLISKHGLERGIVAYNLGSPRKSSTAYSRKVLSIYKRIDAEMKGGANEVN